MNWRYLSGALVSLPLLPLMYHQGKRIRASVPQLSEAEGTEGHCACDDGGGRTIRLICMGESTMAGVGVQTHEEGFAGTLASELSTLFNRDVRWKVYARSGYTARRMESRILPGITESQVDLIVIGLGANDAFTLNRPAKWRSEVRSLIESVKSRFPDALILFIDMPPIKEFPAFTPLIRFTVGNLVEILGDELSSIASGYPDVFCLSEKLTIQGWIDRYRLNVDKKDFFSDGVHPSKLTYQIWARHTAIRMSDDKLIRDALDRRV